jgi:hypothetical protein
MLYTSHYINRTPRTAVSAVQFEIGLLYQEILLPRATTLARYFLFPLLTASVFLSLLSHGSHYGPLLVP